MWNLFLSRFSGKDWLTMTEKEIIISQIKNGAAIFFYDQNSSRPSDVKACVDTNCDKMTIDDLGHKTLMAHCRAHNWKMYAAGKCDNKTLHGEPVTTDAGTELFT